MQKKIKEKSTKILNRDRILILESSLRKEKNGDTDPEGHISLRAYGNLRGDEHGMYIEKSC